MVKVSRSGMQFILEIFAVSRKVKSGEMSKDEAAKLINQLLFPEKEAEF